MKQTAVVVAPGRGTYNAAELGYLSRFHPDRSDMLASFDAYRQEQGQDKLSDLDSAGRFSASRYTRGDVASPLIFASAYFDFLAIDRDKYEIVGVTGNSMGWYIALTCAGALPALQGLRLVNTMGTLMQEHLIGGQLVYPIVDGTWSADPDRRAEVVQVVADIQAHPDHILALSIDLGGMLVLAGNEAGLQAFEAAVPRLEDRYPLRLPNHAAFHTALQAPVAEAGQARLPQSMARQPDVPLVDGRGGLWWPHAADLDALWRYTLGHQVTEPYDFAAAIRVAARELMPDLFIVLGPGGTLGGAVAQSMVQAGWRGMTDKSSFRAVNGTTPRLLAMGQANQRAQVVRS